MGSRVIINKVQEVHTVTAKFAATTISNFNDRVTSYQLIYDNDLCLSVAAGVLATS